MFTRGSEASKENPRRAGLYFGHFAFGIADVIREPLADELRFDITYYQIYTHNVDGLVAGDGLVPLHGRSPIRLGWA